MKNGFTGLRICDIETTEISSSEQIIVLGSHRVSYSV